MKLDAIHEEWGRDSGFDQNDLGNEALKIPTLHHKYHRILSNERLLQKKYEMDLKQLRLEKQEFLVFGPTRETQERGWELPPSGRVMKSDVQHYLDADPAIVDLTLKIGIQAEKVSLLDSIVRTIINRNFIIKSWIDFEKFKNGVV